MSPTHPSDVGDHFTIATVIPDKERTWCRSAHGEPALRDTRVRAMEETT